MQKQELHLGNINFGKTDKITASTNSGGIRIEGINTYCNLSATSGSIKVEKCKLTENSSISAKSGGVHIKEINDIFVNAKATSGSVKVKNTNRKADIEINIETTSGSIKVD